MTYKRNNQILLISLSLLTISSVLLYVVRDAGNEGTPDKNLFTIENLSSIDKIILHDEEKNVELHYNGNRWQVNSRHYADSRLITVLFAMLEQVRPRRILSDSLYAATYNKGVRVTLYQDVDKIDEFYVGGNRQKTQTFFYSTDRGRYLMGIPGYTVYIAGIVELDELAWREKRVFDFDWGTFRALTVSFSNDPLENFTVENKNSGIVVSGLEKIDTLALSNYLDAFSSLSADRFIRPQSSAYYDSLLGEPYDMRFDIKNTNDQTYSLFLYYASDPQKHFLGKKKEDEIMLFEEKEIAKIMHHKEHFREKI